MASELKVGAVINYVAIGVRLATGFLLTPFMIESLGSAEYGLFMLCNTVLAWISLTDFGLGGTVSKYVATYHAKDERDKEAHFLGQSMLLFSVLGFITLVVGFVCYIYLGDIFPDLTTEQMERLEIMYLLTLSNLILAFPLRPLGCVPEAYLKFVVPGLVRLLLSLLNLVLVIMLLCWGYKAIGLTVANVVFGVIGLLWGMYYTFRVLGVRIIFRKPDMALYREMFSFSFWLLLNNLMDLFYWKAGTPILTRLSGVESVMLFTIGISFSQYFLTASRAISNVVYPKIMHMVAHDASKRDLTITMIRAGRMQLAVLIVLLCGFAFLGEPFLALWVGKSTGDATPIVWLGALLVLVPLILPLTQNVGIALLQALNIHRGRAIILFYSSVVCVVLGGGLSYYFGVLGMYIGTAVSLFFGQGILINLYYKRKAGIDIALFFRKTYGPLVLPLSLMLMIGGGMAYWLNVDSWESFFSATAAYGVISAILLWLFYLTPDERNMMFGSLMKKFRHRRA